MSKPLRVCLWGPDILDGQRQIWLLQSTHMNRTEYQFIWILDLKMSSDNDNDNIEDMMNHRSMNNRSMDEGNNMYSMNIEGEEMKKVHHHHHHHQKKKKHYSIYDSLVLLPNVKIVNHPTLVVNIGKYPLYYLFPSCCI